VLRGAGLTLGLDRRRLSAAGAAGPALAAAYSFDPSRSHLPLCPLHALTGLWCPFCGGTRAVHALLHGRFDLALHDNALLVIGLPLWLALGLRWAGVLPPGRLPRQAVWTVAAVGLAFAVLRNLPAGSWLAPPG